MGVFKERNTYVAPTVPQLKSGNSAIWDGFYPQARSRLNPIAEGMVPGRGEELVQDAILGLLTKLPELPDDTEVMKYLGRSVVNGARSFWRHEHGRSVSVVFNSEVVEAAAMNQPGSSNVEDQATDNVFLQSSLESLPSRLREIAALNAAGFTDRQISERLGITTGGVSSQLFKARTALQANA